MWSKFEIGYEMGYGNQKKHFMSLAKLDLTEAMDENNAKDIAIMLEAAINQRVNYKNGTMIPREKQKEIIIREENQVGMEEIKDTIESWNATLKNVEKMGCLK